MNRPWGLRELYPSYSPRPAKLRLIRGPGIGGDSRACATASDAELGPRDRPALPQRDPHHVFQYRWRRVGLCLLSHHARFYAVSDLGYAQGLFNTISFLATLALLGLSVALVRFLPEAENKA